MKENFQLNEEEELRYDRQIKEFGAEAQKKILKSRVAIIGLGGLGSAAGYYLAAAGMGELILVDSDKVELSNLNRQIIHTEDDLGRKKVESASEKLKKLNSGLKIETIDKNIKEGNLDLLKEPPIVIGAVDNFQTRYLLNSYCVENRLNLIHAGIEGAKGQVTTVIPGKTPCLGCLFPGPREENSSFSALGTTAGIMGNFLANETLKLITGYGEPLAGKLLYCDLAKNQFNLISVEKDENCPVCGSAP